MPAQHTLGQRPAGTAVVKAAEAGTAEVAAWRAMRSAPRAVSW